MLSSGATGAREDPSTVWRYSGKGSRWHLLGGGQGAAEQPAVHRRSLTENHRAQMPTGLQLSSSGLEAIQFEISFCAF